VKQGASKTIFPIAGAVLAVLVMTLLSGCAPKRNFAGTWNGSVSFAMPPAGQNITLPLVFHVTKNDDGTYSSTFDITTLKMTAMPVKSFVVDGDKVTMVILVATASASFSGTANADATEITGSLTQGSNSTSLKLTKAPDAK